MTDCIHVHLTKQVGPMDGGAESKRYACQCGENFTVDVQRIEVQFGSPRKVGEDGASRIPRCMARNSETGQCELREGHAGKHLGGYLMWGSSSVPVGEQKQEEGV